MEEKRPGLQKALRVAAVLLLLCSVILFLVLAFTFIVAFFIGGQIIADGSGLMRFFLKPIEAGQRPIAAGLFGFAGLPALSAAALLLVFSCELLFYLRKRKKDGPAFPDAKKHLSALCVLAALQAVIPVIVWAFCAPQVARSGFFTLPFPVPVAGCVLLILSLLPLCALRRAETAVPAQEGDI